MKPSYESNILLKRCLSWFFVVLCIFVIFTFSSQNGVKSNGLSMYTLKKILFFFKISGVTVENNACILNELHYLLRKIAHFSEYLIFTGILYRALKLCSLRTLKNLVLSLVICVICALFDETNQIITPQRTPNLTDVMIDAAGGVFMIFTIIFFKVLRKEE